MIAIALPLVVAQAAMGETFSSGSTGADGPLTPEASQNLTVKAGGVYHYTSIDIPTGVTVRYIRGPDNAPVTILVSGEARIRSGGVISVEGSPGAASGFFNIPIQGGLGGPGGFQGGSAGQGGVLPTAGWGPGGGAPNTGSGFAANTGGGSYGAPAGYVGLNPLVGGSGGGGASGGGLSGGSGGGGGGAILIASSTRIIVDGTIRANGGAAAAQNGTSCPEMPGPGSGGAIRLVAPEISGGGFIQAIPGTSQQNPGGCAQLGFGTVGRIRMEAFTLSGYTGATNPIPSIVTAPGPVSPAGNPALLNVPTLAIASIGNVPPPTLPAASYFTPDISLPTSTPNPVPVLLNLTNTPVGAPTVLTVRVTPQTPGTATNVVVPSAEHTGTQASSTATAQVNLTAGVVTLLQAHASMTLTGQTASLFPLIDGEPVEQVAMVATPGQPSTLSLLTRSGKERRVDELPLEDQMRVVRAWDAIKATRTE